MPIPKLKTRSTRQYGAINYNHRNRPTYSTKPRLKSKRKSWLKIFLIVILVLSCVGIIGGTGAVVWISRDLPSPDRLIDRDISQSTKIYDRTGKNLLYEIYGSEKRTLVALENINNYAKQATVALEDKHFYEHKGIRMTSILRATVNNLLGRKSGGGGASTLTQQLIKNAVIGNEHSYFRKIKEAIIAIRLEKKYSKDEILKMYLNEIPYGSTNYGIEAAAQSYFKKSAKTLTLAEAATLAAIPQSPTRYLYDLPTLTARRDTAIKLMYDQGYITEKEKNDAQNTALNIKVNSGKLEAPHFVLYVKQLLSDSFGEKTVDEGGLKVITTLDYNKQKIAENAVEEIGKLNAKKYNANNASLVAIDPKTGEILAMVGSRDFDNDQINGKYNVAVLGKRQPGSSFKPFIYLAAFDKGYTPETVVYDVETDFGKNSAQKYLPTNYTHKEYGLITFRQALQGSLNITAVKALYLVGVENMIKLASEKFGYTTFTGDYGLSLVLGGGEVTLLEHTAAYAALANEGKYNKPITILKVEDKKGNEIYKAKKPINKKAIDKNIVAILDNVLSDDSSRAWLFGANSKLTLPGRPVAAKTGTTNDSKDAWTMGYTPSLATGVWVGNTQPSPMKGGGSTLATPIWNKFMRKALDKTPAEEFPKPEKQKTQNPWLNGSTGGIKIKINKKTGKIASSSTPDELIIEKIYLPPHTILHYINKNDPNSSGNSQNDPQYQIWEDSLQTWISKQQNLETNLSISDPPTEYDKPGDSELIPTLKILSPINSSTLKNRQINFKVDVSAPRGVDEVIYYVDDKKIGSSKNSPFDFNYYAKTLSKGNHTFKIIASDDQGNSSVKYIKVNLDVELDPPNFNWLDANLSLEKNDYPRVFYISAFRWDNIKDIKIYLKSTLDKKLIYTFNKNEKIYGNRLQFTWNNYPGSGNYTLYGIMTDSFGKTIEKALNIKIK